MRGGTNAETMTADTVAALAGKLDYNTTVQDVTVNGCTITITDIDKKVAQISMANQGPTATGDFTTTLPFTITGSFMTVIQGNANVIGMVWGFSGSKTLNLRFNSTFAYQGFSVVIIKG